MKLYLKALMLGEVSSQHCGKHQFRTTGDFTTLLLSLHLLSKYGQRSKIRCAASEEKGCWVLLERNPASKEPSRKDPSAPYYALLLFHESVPSISGDSEVIVALFLHLLIDSVLFQL